MLHIIGQDEDVEFTLQLKNSEFLVQSLRKVTLQWHIS